MADIFLEIVVKAAEATAVGIESRDEIEDVLERVLSDSGVAEVTGGGGGSGVYVVDIEIESEDKFEDALSVIRAVLQELNVPKSTQIKRGRPSEKIFAVYA